MEGDRIKITWRGSSVPRHIVGGGQSVKLLKFVLGVKCGKFGSEGGGVKPENSSQRSCLSVNNVWISSLHLIEPLYHIFTLVSRTVYSLHLHHENIRISHVYVTWAPEGREEIHRIITFSSRRIFFSWISGVRCSWRRRVTCIWYRDGYGRGRAGMHGVRDGDVLGLYGDENVWILNGLREVTVMRSRWVAWRKRFGFGWVAWCDPLVYRQKR